MTYFSSSTRFKGKGYNYMIKLIAIDIDGTLVNSKRELTPRVKQAIQTASQAGIRVVLCTGRPLPGVVDLLNELNLVSDHDFVITYNGSLVQRTGDGATLAGYTLGYDTLQLMDEYSKKYNVHYHAIDTQAIHVFSEDIPKYSQHESNLVHMPIQQHKLEDISPDREFIKMMFIDEAPQLDQLTAHRPAELYDHYNIVRSAEFYLEVLHKQASKGRAVAQLASILNLSGDEVMCIGDHENDLDMIEFAGVGVAMGNAIPEVKNIATFITTSNDEDGVAVAIEKYM